MWWARSVLLFVAKRKGRTKMDHHETDSRTLGRALEILTENGMDGMAKALEIMFNTAMKIERGEFLKAGPFERTDERIGHANGFKPRRVQTRAGALELAIPQVRGLDDGAAGFYPQSLERGVRSERALKLALAEMYVQGVSTRKVMAITEKLCGFEVSSTQVSRAMQGLDTELQAWRDRPIGEIPYLILDARYEKVRHGGAVIDSAVLIAIGITPQGRRSILGVSVSLSEAEVHWRQFLASLRERGLHGMRLIISDDHAGLKAARQAELTASHGSVVNSICSGTHRRTSRRSRCAVKSHALCAASSRPRIGTKHAGAFSSSSSRIARRRRISPPGLTTMSPKA